MPGQSVTIPPEVSTYLVMVMLLPLISQLQATVPLSAPTYSSSWQNSGSTAFGQSSTVYSSMKNMSRSRESTIPMKGIFLLT